MESGSETLVTQVHDIYQLFCVFNFFATTHRLSCDPLLTDLGGWECISFGTNGAFGQIQLRLG